MEKHKELLYTPRFVGERFEGHSLPLEFLDDLQVLGKINTAIAKWLWKEKNQGRRRGPRGFDKGISYAITGIGEGSAVPALELIAPKNGMFPAEFSDYFQQGPAILSNAIQVLDEGGDPTTILPQEILLMMESFGSSLHPDEHVEFRPKQAKAARYTVQNRKSLLVNLSKDKDYTKDATLLGQLIDLNKEKRTFELRTVLKRVSGEYSEEHYADLMEAFSEDTIGKKKPVLISGTVRFNAFDSPRAVKKVQGVTILEPMDIQWQLEALKSLKDGWFEGHGMAYNAEAIDNLFLGLDAFYNLNKLPSIYPNPEGLVNLEWDNAGYDITLEVDTKTLKGEYHALDLKTKQSEVKTISLVLDDDRKWLLGALAKAGIQ